MPNRIYQLAAGSEHYLMSDKFNQLWVGGDNHSGCLGLTDSAKFKKTPRRNFFFVNKRIIDIACGNGFSVVIAESFNLTMEQSKEYFAYQEMQMSKSKKRVMAVSSGSIKKRYKALNTDKVHIKNTKIFLSDITGTKNQKIVPRDVQNKVSALLGKKDYKSVNNSPRYKATFIRN